MTDIEDIVKQIKPVRSWSGVLVITVVMEGNKMSCGNNCYYCPDESIKNGANVNQPRSYLSNEPAVARGNRHGFDPIQQVHGRLNMLKKNGHTLSKLEIIVLGGTFSHYSRQYQEDFICGIFYAANTFNDESPREMQTLSNEKLINEDADKQIIGLSLESRPDAITIQELKRFRLYGCTRIQIGVQHTDNTILNFVNRGHTVEQSIKAIQLIKEFGFKLDLHIMPDLPGTTPEKDKIMIKEVLTNPKFIPDYLKIYPCLDVDYTEIKKWKTTGKWIPYAEIDDGTTLLDVCLIAKEYSKEYIRFNRIQRDFSEKKDGIIGYSSKNIKTNFRQILQLYAKKKNIYCKCIRCREVKKQSIHYPILTSQSYYASKGKENFISINSYDNKILYGFIRVRFNIVNSSFKELNNYALIRELHVYGFIAKKNCATQIQHQGFGKVLMARAEIYSYISGFRKIAVISGVGVRNYYRKLGYTLQLSTEYMCKKLTLYIILINIMTVIKFYIKSYFKYYTT